MDKERLEAIRHPRNAALTGRSMRSAYVGGRGVLQAGERKDRGGRLWVLQMPMKNVIMVHVPTWLSQVKGTTAESSQAALQVVLKGYITPECAANKFLPARRRRDARGLDPKGSGPLCV